MLEAEGWALLDAASRTVFETLLDRLRAQGVTVLRRGDHPLLQAFERSLEGVQALTNGITAWENHWALRNLIAQQPEGVSQRARGVVALAEAMSPEDYRMLILQREELRRRHAALAPLAEALIAPASPGPAPLWAGDVPGQPLAKRPTGDAVYNTPSSALGAPVVTVPLAAVGGMPLGIQLMGQPHADAAVTAVARWVQATVAPVVG
ncbi:amidase family protein [Paeniroseomonas aquatica]|uniref:amidase family protein n=1 Tax=Paeniroseomonas aquatica TaxID=373043 RepID=UPI00361D68CE